MRVCILSGALFESSVASPNSRYARAVFNLTHVCVPSTPRAPPPSPRKTCTSLQHSKDAEPSLPSDRTTLASHSCPRVVWCYRATLFSNARQSLRDEYTHIHIRTLSGVENYHALSCFETEWQEKVDTTYVRLRRIRRRCEIADRTQWWWWHKVRTTFSVRRDLLHSTHAAVRLLL